MLETEGLLNRLVTVAVMGLLSWQVYTTQTMTVDLAVLRSEVNSIKDSLHVQTLDRYTSDQAKADQALMEQRIGRLEDWNQNLSERLRQLEQERRGK